VRCACNRCVEYLGDAPYDLSQVAAVKGRLLVFSNVIHGTNVRHPLAEHAGMPVSEGEKLAFNLWFRERCVILYGHGSWPYFIDGTLYMACMAYSRLCALQLRLPRPAKEVADPAPTLNLSFKMVDFTVKNKSDKKRGGQKEPEDVASPADAAK